MQRGRLSLRAVFATLAVVCGQFTGYADVPATPVDLVIINARIFTADPARPWAESVAIRGTRIAAVGSRADLLSLEGTAKRVIDAGGRVVVPGINDAHVHEPSWAEPDNVAVRADASAEELLAEVRAAAEKLPAGTWLQGTVPVALVGSPKLTRDTVDAVASRHPVCFEIGSGHAALLNTAALRAWQIGEGDPDPAGGWYARTTGRLNGWIYEHAYWRRARDEAGRLSDERLLARMERFAARAVRHGITTVQTMPMVDVARLDPLLARLQVPLRWRLMQIHMGTVEPTPLRPAKYILDGAPMERGAALRSDYSDKPGHRGRENYSDAQLAAIVATAARTEQQVLLHIIGDRVLEKLFEVMAHHRVDWPAKRLRIEHGSFIGEFVPQAKRAGVILVQNPTHFGNPAVMLARFGAKRSEHFDVLRTALEAGIPIAFGSDGPINPWVNVQLATTHPRNPREALTREQAVAAYTRGSAYAEFTEGDKGTIAPGMLADLAMLSQDPFKVSLDDLPNTEALLTVVGGAIAYERPR